MWSTNALFFSLLLMLGLLMAIFPSGDGFTSSVLSRRKRYLVFPEGASWSIAFCMTAQTIIESGIWSEGINWGIAYDLPNETNAFQKFHKFSAKHVAQRRHRRDLYNKMELIMNSMGYDGRSCVFKSLCEVAQKYADRGSTIVEEIFRIIFKFPQQKILKSEPEDHRLYHWAYRRGKENPDLNCNEMFATCPISLLDMALGYYMDYGSEYSTEGSLNEIV